MHRLRVWLCNGGQAERGGDEIKPLRERKQDGRMAGEEWCGSASSAPFCSFPNPNHTCAGPSDAHTNSLSAYPTTSTCYQGEARPAFVQAKGVHEGLPRRCAPGTYSCGDPTRQQGGKASNTLEEKTWKEEIG